MNLNEVRKEDDYFCNGEYWIVANNFGDILAGDYKVIGTKYYVDFDGNKVEQQKYFSHKDAWKDLYEEAYGVGYTYYPRGRINAYKGKIYINTNSKVTNSNIIGDVLDYYDLTRHYSPEDVIITCNDRYGDQGAHYGFELE